MIITTAGRPSAKHIELAASTADDLNGTFINRKKRSVQTLLSTFQKPMIVIGESRYEYYQSSADSPFFFHPNSSAFRLKRIKNGEVDPLIEVSQLIAGDTFIDCTLGIGSDAIVASAIAGKGGNVIGVEANKIIAYLVAKGLENWKTEDDSMKKAMGSIQVVNDHYLHFLQNQPDKSADVVYFDPMFEEDIQSSTGIRPLKDYALYEDDFLMEAVSEARRVARKRVVLKDHFRSNRFDQLGFTVIKRPSSKQHYGFIQLS